MDILDRMNVPEEKQRLRMAMQERLLHSPTKNLALESRLICKKLEELLPEPPLVLAAFFPLKSEPDLRPFLREALRKGMELYLPTAGDRSFLLRSIHSFRDLHTGPWNIPEPSKECPTLDPMRLHYALIPGRAFDQSGWRIGRGGAGYDQWIRAERAENPHTIFWGIAFECQILPHVPHVEHDERVDGIITARGLIATKNIDDR